MKAYVTLRGTRSARQITRDASLTIAGSRSAPIRHSPAYPFASLVLGTPAGSSYSFDLTHVVTGNFVLVELVRCGPDGSREIVYREDVEVGNTSYGPCPCDTCKAYRGGAK